MSELVYALSQVKDLRDKKHLRVMSVGCGPCTDLFALDYLNENGIFKFETIEYRGIDLAKTVWGEIHKQIKNIIHQNIIRTSFTKMLQS